MVNRNHVVFLNRIDYDEIARRETSQFRRQVGTPAAHSRVPGQQRKTVGYALHNAVCRIDTAAFPRDKQPDIVELSFRVGGRR